MYLVNYRERIAFCEDTKEEVLIKEYGRLQYVKYKDIDTNNKFVRTSMFYEKTGSLSTLKDILTEDLIKAENLVKSLFSQKVDLAGKPYINHLRFVKDNVETLEEKIVALLHDVLEDTDINYKFLVACFGANIAQSVSILTKEKDEDYFDYTRRIKGHYVASNVKMADLKHNMDLSRLKNIEDKDRERVEKYKKAMRILKGEED